MSSLETVLAELGGDPDLWWGHVAEHGWVVLDRRDVRNRDPDSRRLVRCRDWTPIKVPRQEYGSSRFAFFKTYLSSLPAAEAEEAAARLLALHREFVAKLAGFRLTKEDQERQRWEEENRMTEEKWHDCEAPDTLLAHMDGKVSSRQLGL